jgi:uncharacterized protein YjiS (DUF1127 family)
MTRIVGSGAQGSTFTLALLGVAMRAVTGFATALKNRRAVRELNDLDDRALKDIGLMRTDVTAALDRPLHLDPSQHLVAVAGYGRGGRTPVKPAVAPGIARLRGADAPVTPVAGMAACG